MFYMNSAGLKLYRVLRSLYYVQCSNLCFFQRYYLVTLSLEKVPKKKKEKMAGWRRFMEDLKTHKTQYLNDHRDRERGIFLLMKMMENYQYLMLMFISI